MGGYGAIGDDGLVVDIDLNTRMALKAAGDWGPVLPGGERSDDKPDSWKKGSSAVPEP
jgi:hypothetical protein